MTNSNACDSCRKECDASVRKQDETDEQFRQRQAIARRMCRIKTIYIVLSGKGGVGKSTVAANLAVQLAARDKAVGLLDVDFHGPSIPKLFGIEDARLSSSDGSEIEPIRARNVAIMSIGLALADNDDAVIWRGPMKYAAARQFLADVAWGDLDYLIIDSPPGTGDEPLSVIQLIGSITGAIIVTTPQQVAVHDVRRSVTFCRQLDLPISGLVENMSGFVCPHCREHTAIFNQGGGQDLAEDMNVPYLGALPIDPAIVADSDTGRPGIGDNCDKNTKLIFNEIVDKLETAL